METIKSRLSRIGGWALTLAGLSFFLYLLFAYAVPEDYSWDFQNPNFSTAYVVTAYILVPLFMLFGLLGLWARYGEEVGWLGRNVLLAGALSAPLAVYLFYTPVFLIAGMTVGAFYYGTIPALTIGQICLAVFGVSALKHKPFPRLNWLPLAAGVWFPVVYPLHFMVPSRTFVFNWGVFYAPNLVEVLIYTMACGQAAAMILLGWIVRDDAHKQETIPPTNQVED